MTREFRCKFSINSDKKPDPNAGWSIGTWEICALAKWVECSGWEGERSMCPYWSKEL